MQQARGHQLVDACLGLGCAGLQSSGQTAHELLAGLFDRLSRLRPGSQEWRARLNVACDLIERHIRSEHEEVFARLGRRFDAAALAEMGRRFELARDKLTYLEEAKAA